jgi:hypothetical protein
MVRPCIPRESAVLSLGLDDEVDVVAQHHEVDEPQAKPIAGPEETPARERGSSDRCAG